MFPLPKLAIPAPEEEEEEEEELAFCCTEGWTRLCGELLNMFGK